MINPPGDFGQPPLFLKFDDNALLPMLFGEHDRHLARVEQELGVSLATRGNQVVISGRPGSAEVARNVLSDLYARLKEGARVDGGEVDAALRMALQGGSAMAFGDSGVIVTQRRQVLPRSPRQASYIAALQSAELVFAIGPAGTGKTYLAVAMAAALLTAGAIDRVILSRPAVEAGERLGYLPGDLRDKVDPYLRPLYDALYDMMYGEKVRKRLENGDIEVAPLAFMRGRTLSNRIRDPRRGAEYDFRANENVLNPSGGKFPHGGHRGSFSDRFAARHKIGSAGRNRYLGRRGGHRDRRFRPGRRGSPRLGYPHRARVRNQWRGPALKAAAAVDEPGAVGARPQAQRIGVRVADRRWHHEIPGVSEICRVAVAAALVRAAAPASEVSVMLADDGTVRELNRRYRRRDAATNVLSFALGGSAPPGGSPVLGDVVLAFETVRDEARGQNKSTADHLRHLLVHGALHLLGYDHERSAEAEAMERLETDILADLGIRDPYDTPEDREIGPDTSIGQTL